MTEDMIQQIPGLYGVGLSGLLNNLPEEDEVWTMGRLSVSVHLKYLENKYNRWPR